MVSVGLVCWDASVLSGVRIVLSILHPYQSRFRVPVGDIFVGLVQQGRHVSVHHLDFGFIVWWHVRMWTALVGRGYNIAKAFECLVAE